MFPATNPAACNSAAVNRNCCLEAQYQLPNGEGHVVVVFDAVLHPIVADNGENVLLAAAKFTVVPAHVAAGPAVVLVINGKAFVETTIDVVFTQSAPVVCAAVKVYVVVVAGEFATKFVGLNVYPAADVPETVADGDHVKLSKLDPPDASVTTGEANAEQFVAVAFDNANAGGAETVTVTGVRALSHPVAGLVVET